eukprot:TRINITY_DN11938_c0_g2_i1.p1 TRINITY_DN11938_c0_g2~~TRINITY_DN11938_c0_g2_i1.p1  ORF type:complete len:116 (-),score=15.27 TRINITY_DN11938_c0_g2_i1:188-535(-)
MPSLLAPGVITSHIPSPPFSARSANGGREKKMPQSRKASVPKPGRKHETIHQQQQQQQQRVSKKTPGFDGLTRFKWTPKASGSTHSTRKGCPPPLPSAAGFCFVCFVCLFPHHSF